LFNGRLRAAMVQWDALQPKRIDLLDKRRKERVRKEAAQAAKGNKSGEGSNKSSPDKSGGDGGGDGGASGGGGVAEGPAEAAALVAAQRWRVGTEAVASLDASVGRHASAGASAPGRHVPTVVPDDLKHVMLRAWMVERDRLHRQAKLTYDEQAQVIRSELRAQSERLLYVHAAKQLLCGNTVSDDDDDDDRDRRERRAIRARIGPPPTRSVKLPAKELGKLIDHAIFEARKARGGGERAGKR
jgi:hypothetical protein